MGSYFGVVNFQHFIWNIYASQGSLARAVELLFSASPTLFSQRASYLIPNLNIFWISQGVSTLLRFRRKDLIRNSQSDHCCPYILSL